MDDFDFLQCDQTATHHRFERGQEGVDLVLGVHDLDDERQIGGEAQNLGGVQAAGLAKTHRAAQDSGTGEIGFAGLKDNCFVEWLVFAAVGFAEIDAELNGVLGELHQ